MKKVQLPLDFYMYKWLFGVKPYIIALFCANCDVIAKTLPKKAENVKK